VSSARVRAAFDRLQRISFYLDSGPPAAARAHLDAIEEHVTGLLDLARSSPRVALLEGPDLWRSLANAVVAIARERRALRVSARDLLDLVQDKTPALHLPFWASRAPETVAGLLRHEAKVRELIEADGVRYWDRHEDDEWRIVNSRHLQAHADIWQWMLGGSVTGARCRFCSLDVNPEVHELVAVEENDLGGVERRGGRVVVPARGAVVHPQCMQQWVAWTAIAARYGTAEEAVAADLAAGRKPRAQPSTALATSEAGA
jgi:hypothetical protein